MIVLFCGVCVSEWCPEPNNHLIHPLLLLSPHHQGALFQSPHTDENDVQTISHKCDVVALSEYRVRRRELERRYGLNYENRDVYYLAGSYDPKSGHITMEPGVS